MTEQEITDNETPEPAVRMHTVYHVFTFDELIMLLVGALRDRASYFEDEIRTESLKGAADRGKMLTLEWGAKEFRDFASVIEQMPPGEFREESEYESVTTDGDTDTQDGDTDTQDGDTDTQDFGVMSPATLGEALNGHFTPFADLGEQTEAEAEEATAEAPDEDEEDEEEEEKEEDFGDIFDEPESDPDLTIVVPRRLPAPRKRGRARRSA